MTIVLAVAGLVVVLYAFLLYLLWRHQERIVFQPPAPDSIGSEHAAQRIAYRAADDAELHGFLTKATRPVGTLLYFHGNAVLARWMIPWARQVATLLQLDVFLAEYRGYDGLPGAPTYATSTRDAEAARQAAIRATGIAPHELIVYGHSLGSAIATELAGRVPVRSLLLEAPFTSARDMAARWPLVSRGVIWPWFSRVHFNSIARVSELETPVHIVHGERDIVIPVEMGRALHAAARNPGELLILPDAGHNDVAARGGRAYWRWFARAAGVSLR